MPADAVRRGLAARTAVLRPGRRGRSLRRRSSGRVTLRHLPAADLRLYRAVRSLAVHEPPIRVARTMSLLGEHAGIWLLLGGAGVLRAGDRDERLVWGRAVAAVAGAHASNVALKRVVRRPRPVIDALPALASTASALSFPSAHTTSSFAAARAYSRLLPPAPLYGAAVLMGFSRVFLGVHYPFDVAAGALLGTLVGSAGRSPAASIPPAP